MNKKYLILVTMCTGYCGENSEDVILADTKDIEGDLDMHQIAQEMARANAEQYGSDGTYICDECGEDSDNSEKCDSCDSHAVEWESSDQVAGSCTLYNPVEDDSTYLKSYPTAMQDDDGAYYVPVISEEYQPLIDMLVSRLGITKAQVLALEGQNRTMRSAISQVKNSISHLAIM